MSSLTSQAPGAVAGAPDRHQATECDRGGAGAGHETAAGSGRYVVLALGTGCGWPGTGVGDDVELVTCETAEEAAVYLSGSRPWSALVTGLSGPLAGPDVLDAARRRGIPVIVPGPPEDEAGPSWVAALRRTASPIPSGIDLACCPALAAAGTWPDPGGRLPGVVVAVCGPGGTGASTVAAAVAAGLGERAGLPSGEPVLLADLALRPGQAILHGLAAGTPALEELVHSHRRGWLTASGTRACTHAPAGRPYRLLTGLAHPSHWTAIRPIAFDAALDSLRRAFPVVVADVTGDLEGETETGSADVEDRNHMARRAVAVAAAVVVVGTDGPTGSLALSRTLAAVGALLHDSSCAVPVVNRAQGDGPRGRHHPGPDQADHPAIRLGPLPSSGPGLELSGWARPVIDAVAAILPRSPQPPPRRLTGAVRIVPGSIGHWGSAG